MLGSHPVADRTAPYLPIHVFEPRRPTSVLSLSSLEGLQTHYRGRTLACPGPAVCRLCEVGCSCRYHGYFAAVVEDRKVLIRLTAISALRCLRHPPEAGIVYRAEQASPKRPVELSRVGSAKVAGAALVSPSMLIQLIMAIHGLGLPEGSTCPSDLRRLASERARALIDGQFLNLQS